MTTRSLTEDFHHSIDQHENAIVTGHTGDANFVDLKAAQLSGAFVNMSHRAHRMTETSEHQQVWLSQNNAPAKGKPRYSLSSFCLAAKLMPSVLSCRQASHYWKIPL